MERAQLAADGWQRQGAITSSQNAIHWHLLQAAAWQHVVAAAATIAAWRHVAAAPCCGQLLFMLACPCCCRCCLTPLLPSRLAPPRKKKAVHKTTSTDDKRLQGTLKRLGVNTIPGIEEVRTGRSRTDRQLGDPSATWFVGSSCPRFERHRAHPLQGTPCCGTHAAHRRLADPPSAPPPLTLLHNPPPLTRPRLQVLLINADGSALQFNNPKVQASIAANTYVVSGASQPKRECLEAAGGSRLLRYGACDIR